MVDLERARKIVSGLHGPDGKRPVIIVDNTMLGPIYQTPWYMVPIWSSRRSLNMSAAIPT
jgi:cystathionine beta-lyase/cystathionine gamma-synthase